MLANFESRDAFTLTSLLLHAVRLETLVEKTNSKTNVNAHTLLVDLASDTVLNENVGRVGAELVATIGDLGDDLGVPLPLGLARGDETRHDDIVDLLPVLTGASSDMGNDVGI
jgi:hypothetical protein